MRTQNGPRIDQITMSLCPNRNETRHGGVKKCGKQILHCCIQYLDEYWAANVVTVKIQQEVYQNWVPPVGLMYKVNVDGAVFSSQKAASVGL